MKKVIPIILLLSCVLARINAQGTLEAALTTIKSQAVYDTLVYFGVDLSQVWVNDAPKISKSLEYSQVYPPAWITFIEENLPPDGFVRYMVGYPHFKYAQQEIFEKSIRTDPTFINGHDKDIPADTINSIVAGYELQSKTGLGLVLIPETFSKPRETATTWVVFFDVKTRQVRYKTKVYGQCAHMGYTAHWATGVVEGFKYFATH